MRTPEQIRDKARRDAQTARDHENWARAAIASANRHLEIADRYRERAAAGFSEAAAESARVNAEFADILGDAA